MLTQATELRSTLSGQDRALTMLTNMVLYQKLHHALFFYGLPTVGKTTAALSLAKVLSCQAYVGAEGSKGEGEGKGEGEHNATHLKSDERAENKAQKAVSSGVGKEIGAGPGFGAGTSLSAENEAGAKANIEARTGKGIGYCNGCKSCQAINFHKSQHVLLLSLDDRIPFIRVLQKLLAGVSSEDRDSVRYQELVRALLSECYLLIARHRQGMLMVLKRKKMAYPEGVVVSEKELEKQLHELYHVLGNFHETGEIAPFLSDAMLEKLTLLQNALDRTYLAKESLERAFAWAQQSISHSGMGTTAVNASGNPFGKMLIIKGIEHIHHTALGKFLKILEDPLPHTRFVLITEHLEALHGSMLAPLLSRCFKISFADLNEYWTEVIVRENLGIGRGVFHKNLATFLRHSALESLNFQQGSKNGSKQGSRYEGNRQFGEARLMLAVLQAWKTPLSYLYYLAREHRDEMQTLLKDLKAALATYLEAQFMQPLLTTPPHLSHSQPGPSLHHDIPEHVDKNAHKTTPANEIAPNPQIAPNPHETPSNPHEIASNIDQTNQTDQTRTLPAATPASSSQSLNSDPDSDSKRPRRHISQKERKLIAVLKEMAFSYKKVASFRTIIQKCERLKEMGVISDEVIINRLALFIRKIY